MCMERKKYLSYIENVIGIEWRFNSSGEKIKLSNKNKHNDIWC